MIRKRAVGMVLSRVAVHAARPGRYSGDGEVHRSLVLEDAGIVEPIDYRRVGFDAPHQAIEAGGTGLERAGEGSQEVIRKIDEHPARDPKAPETTIAGALRG